jgi:integrase/recombinase XerD
MSPLHHTLEDYLRIRRGLGFQLREHERLLNSLIDFLEQQGASHLSTELALAWARQPTQAHPYRWRERLGVARGFARYLAAIDPESEIPSQDLLPVHRPRVSPYIYSKAQITALMRAAGTLRPPLRAATHQTVIGLLAATGMRDGEALALDLTEVDLREGTLQVKAAKLGRERVIPMHRSTTAALSRYAQTRDRLCPSAQTPAFFLGPHGKRLIQRTFERTYGQLLTLAGIERRGARCRPRAHDLRHSFAVHTLLDWQRAGEDVDRRMPLLSTYLGHARIEDTYWYLQAVPELMGLVSGRLEGLQQREATS